jgi:hypothetical protein
MWAGKAIMGTINVTDPKQIKGLIDKMIAEKLLKIVEGRRDGKDCLMVVPVNPTEAKEPTFADEVLQALRVCKAEMMTKTEIGDHFHRNKSKKEIDQALAILEKQNLAFRGTTRPDGGGRPIEVWSTNKRLKLS